ncbi:MAG: branched-chain amino acid ABC transporter ATP-binding protein/permease [Rhodospirillales bacterium]
MIISGTSSGQAGSSALLRSLGDSARISGLLIVSILVVWAFFGNSEQAIATYFLVILTAALAFACFTATSGILSFGHAAFMGLAAHLSAILTMPVAIKAAALPNLPGFLADLQLPFLAALVITVALVTIVAFLVGVPICRLGGSEAAIATLGLLMIGYSVIVGARDFTRGSQALFGVPRAVDLPVALAFAVLAILVVRVFTSSRAGLLVRAVREDEPAAASIGIKPERARLVAWTLSGAVAGLAGVLLGHYLTVFSPKEFYFDLTFSLLVILILGGFASITGAIVGSALVTLLIEVLRRIEQSDFLETLGVGQVFGLTQIGLSLVVLWVLYRHREGLFGHLELTDVLGRLRRGAPVAELPAPQRPVAVEVPEASAGQLRVEGVSKTYGGVVALSDASLAVGAGDIVGLIGPNGSGKTTLLGCIAGTHQPSAGRILLDGRDVTRLPPEKMARVGVGRTFQTIRLFGRLTLRENVAAAVAATTPGRGLAAAYARADALLALFAIADLAEREARTLAYGQQRRLEIARAMALNPQFLLLDEPAAGMNEAESDDLLATLARVRRDHGIGILIVDHDLRLIMRLCDRIVVLNKGSVIAQGAPEAVRHDEAVRVAYLGSRRSERGQQ